MSVQFSGYQASPSHVGSASFPTPSSRFAVRYVHGFCLMLPSDTPISGNALALSASSFRPVTADHHVPGFAWNGGLCVMPGTRRNPRPKGVVRVHRLCQMHDSIVSPSLSCPHSIKRGETNESISKTITHDLALSVPYCVDAKI